MCRTRLAGNTGRKNDAKNRHLHTIAQLCHAVSSQLRHLSTIGKNLLNSNSSSTGPHNMANFGPLKRLRSVGSLGHPSKFQRVLHLGFITAATSLIGGQPNFARYLAVSWAGTLYIHFRGLLPPEGILPGAKFTMRPSLASSILAALLHGTRAVGVSETLWR